MDAGHLVVDGRAASDQAEQRVATAAETQPRRQPLARSAAQRQGDLVDELIGASRPARKAPGNDIRQRLGKRRAGARRFRTAKRRILTRINTRRPCAGRSRMVRS